MSRLTAAAIGLALAACAAKQPVIEAPPPPPPADAPDRDEDGVSDTNDACPDVPASMADGCPRDMDHDGTVDNDDKCPSEAEDKDGFQDDDGCPDVDNDGDRVADARDKCPNDAETLNGFQDDDGCPDTKVKSYYEDPFAPQPGQLPPPPKKPDRDGDGIPDSDDVCPDLRYSRDCLYAPPKPPPKKPADRDKDGLPDGSDKCPDQPETKNGLKDGDGCPD